MIYSLWAATCHRKRLSQLQEQSEPEPRSGHNVPLQSWVRCCRRVLGPGDHKVSERSILLAQCFGPSDLWDSR